MGRVIVIAEAGVNHNGNIEIAMEMVDKAKTAGVDYIKFQTFTPEKLVSKYADKADYQKRTTGSNESQLQMLKKLALKLEDFKKIKSYCDSLGIGFISTPFDFTSIDFLETLNMDFWKIPSGEITNLPYLEKIASTGRDIVISTGMCDMEEIKDAIGILQNGGSGKITVLHCNTEYPTPFVDVNLKAMLQIGRETGMPIGYSDHTLGIEIVVGAVALGATIIEKHFTLDKNMDGPDHRASLDPLELKAMVTAIRNVESGLGDGIKRRTVSEEKNVNLARKSIVASKSIKKGEIFTIENITTKRPGTGLSPMKWYDVIGTEANMDYSEDDFITM